MRDAGIQWTTVVNLAQKGDSCRVDGHARHVYLNVLGNLAGYGKQDDRDTYAYLFRTVYIALLTLRES